MANFSDDLGQEKILSTYLDTVYAKKIEFKRVFDIDLQHQGIDIIITHNSIQYFVDEKAQLHYLNKDLPTFTFEISYMKNGSFRKGWLLDMSKRSQYYFLITGIFLKGNKNKLESPYDIGKVKITSVNRNKLIKYLDQINLTETALLDYDSTLRANSVYGKNNIVELDSKSQGLIYFTEHLKEKPINLQLRLNFLVEIGVAKKFHG